MNTSPAPKHPSDLHTRVHSSSRILKHSLPGRSAWIFAAIALTQLGMGARGCSDAECVVDGVTYSEGDTFPADDGCNTCSCTESGEVACTLIACAETCGGLTGAACSDGQFCDFPVDALCGAADATGTCRLTPEVCADIFAPVCGCDDQTYGNACEANAAGVSVVSEGECGNTGGSLQLGDSCGGFQLAGAPTCADGLFCQYAPEDVCGAADAPGTCAAIPEVCDAVFLPVCGCDDQTYGNACEAAVAGVSVASEGECDGGGNGNGGGECVVGGATYSEGDTFPADDGCNQCSCIENGQVVCTLIACAAPCGGLTGAGCPDDEFCAFAPEALCGAADATGTCRARPEACIQIFDPVCGCDGQTYGNSCDAASAGVSVAADGECDGEGGKQCTTDLDCPQPACACLDENGDGICENHCPTYGCRQGQCVDVSPPGDGTLGVGDSCGGFVPPDAPTCASGLFCQHQPGALCGAADAPGECVAIPQACDLILAPVCGCDGVTYDNACFAALAQAGILDNGACN